MAKGRLRRNTLWFIGGVLLALCAWGTVGIGCGSGAGTGGSNPGVWPAGTFTPGEALDPNEMRISFLGTSFLPRLSQEQNSVFVELGNGDSFVFDIGSGVYAKYNAMGIPPSRMDKIFMTHLHADHTSDLVAIYAFGPSEDRKTPLYLFGPSADDPSEGTQAFADALKQLMKWHVESFSFLSTGTVDQGDGYDIIATELPYMDVGGVAYEANGVRITHWPAVHARDGAISYRLDWNGMSMVFSGDSKPNDYMISQAQGVDVLIHEMVVPAATWAEKNGNIYPGDPGWDQALNYAQSVQDSSHTPQKAFGYILSKTNPRLGVATHFQSEDDTNGPALTDIGYWYQGPVTIAKDLLVINVSKSQIRLRTAVVSDNAWYPAFKAYPAGELAPPKYPTPTAQLSDELLSHCIASSTYDPQ